MTNYGLINAIAFIGFFIFLAGVLLSIFREKQTDKYLSFGTKINTNELSPFKFKDTILFIIKTINQKHIFLFIIFFSIFTKFILFEFTVLLSLSLIITILLFILIGFEI